MMINSASKEKLHTLANLVSFLRKPNFASTFVGVWIAVALLLAPLTCKSSVVGIIWIFLFVPSLILSILYLCANWISSEQQLRVGELVDFIRKNIIRTTLICLIIAGIFSPPGLLMFLLLFSTLGIFLFYASGLIFGWFVSFMGLPDGLGYVGGSTIFLAITIVFSLVLPKTLFLGLYSALFKNYPIVKAIRLNYEKIKGRTYWFFGDRSFLRDSFDLSWNI